MENPPLSPLLEDQDVSLPGKFSFILMIKIDKFVTT